MIKKNLRLAIYDFDHTLCFSDGTVKVLDKDSGQITNKLSAMEYTAFRESDLFDPNVQDFDFSDFQSPPKNGRPILWSMNKLKNDIKDPDCNVALVTGRDDLLHPKQWLDEQQIDTNKMILMCSGDPNKSFCYESLLINLSPSAVEIYEDGKSYVMQCVDICMKYSVPCDAYLITEEIIKNHQTGSVNLIMAR